MSLGLVGDDLRLEIEKLVLSRGGDVEWGVRRNFEPENQDYTWDGSTLHLPLCDTPYESALHEVAHVLVAPARRLAMPEYGLGSDPGNGTDAPLVIDHYRAEEEESRVCSLHWALAAYYIDAESAWRVMHFVNIGRLPRRNTICGIGARFPQLPRDFTEVVLSVQYQMIDAYKKKRGRYERP